MSDLQYDFVVIGGGSAGYGAANQAVMLGLSTAVIEGGDEVGGLCILRGCMPSKTFLESGHRANAIRRAGEFGLKAEYGGASGPSILERKRALIADFAGYRKEQLESGKFAFWRGLARFTGPNTVLVDLREEGRTIEIRGRTFLVATGSQIRWLPVPGLPEAGVLSSDEVLESDRVPESVIVLGGGPTGLEFASYYAGVGIDVTVVQRGEQILRGADRDVADALQAALEHRGIKIFTGTELEYVEKGRGRKRVGFRHEGKAEVVTEAEEIVYALGRAPNVAPLEPHAAGIPVRKWGGIHVNPQQQTAVAHIFAAGDVCGPYEVVHIAIQQAELAARNAAKIVRGEEGPLEEIDYSMKLFAVFTHPEAAWVGLTAREATELGLMFVEARYPFADHGKAMMRGETEGFVKMLADRREGRIVGAAVIGAEASELIHEVTVAMRFCATAAQFAAIPHYHPTLSEIWTYPAEALAMLKE